MHRRRRGTFLELALATARIGARRYFFKAFLLQGTVSAAEGAEGGGAGFGVFGVEFWRGDVNKAICVEMAGLIRTCAEAG